MKFKSKSFASKNSDSDFKSASQHAAGHVLLNSAVSAKVSVALKLQKITSTGPILDIFDPRKPVRSPQSTAP